MIMRENFGSFIITDERELILSRAPEIHALLKNAYWASDRSESTTKEAIKNSLNYAVFDESTGKAVAFARVITDFSTVFYLCDVFVEEKYRGKGTGNKLVGHILQRDERISGISGLLKTRDAVKLYEKYGFEECQSICMTRR